MTRTVADAAAELQAIAGPDPEDPVTADAPTRGLPGGLKTDALAGKRIGVIANTNAQYLAAVAAVQALGATTVQVTCADARRAVRRPHRRVQARPERVPRPPPASAPMKSLADIIAFNTAHADEALKFGQGC